jgi:dolichol-phosphate mannosyltransferase
MVKGLARFMAVCSVGALANVGIAEYLFNQRQGRSLPAIGGLLGGTVWNFWTSAFYTRDRRG